MVISQPAMIGLEQARERVERSVVAIWARTRARLSRTAGEAIAVAATGSGSTVAMTSDVIDEPGPVGAVPPAPPSSEPEPEPAVSPLTAEERRARAGAVRGLMLARKRCYGSAQAAFAEAATLDPRLDLAGVPTFWELHRAGQETAVRAYEDAGRIRDAAVLAATLRHTFRPRAVAPRRSGSESVPS